MASKQKHARIDFTANAIEKEGKAQFDVVGMHALMFGFNTIMWILFSIRHVPKVFSRYKNTRFTIISRIVKYLCPESSLTDVVVEEILDILEKFAPNMPLAETYSNDFDDALKAVTKAEEMFLVSLHRL
ncbi:Hypothetical predicted protein [Paramuricea clavata]|uniref:Uncharacterized protein n=1 Tax=Paramuricea clavata TaxID=317549 RepID=A0A7D9ECA1_PARCT|nr:Hypothetical predicted protein [Paramuricea clavata]